MSKRWFSAALIAVMLTVFLAPAAVLADGEWISADSGSPFSLFPNLFGATATPAQVPDATVQPEPTVNTTPGGQSLYPGWNVPTIGPDPVVTMPPIPTLEPVTPIPTEEPATPAPTATPGGQSFFSGWGFFNPTDTPAPTAPPT